MKRTKSRCNHCRGPAEKTICDSCMCKGCKRLNVLCECKKQKRKAAKAKDCSHKKDCMTRAER